MRSPRHRSGNPKNDLAWEWKRSEPVQEVLTWRKLYGIYSGFKKWELQRCSEIVVIRRRGDGIAFRRIEIGSFQGRFPLIWPHPNQSDLKCRQGEFCL